MSKGQRFEKIYTQGAMTTTEIWVDRQTRIIRTRFLSVDFSHCRVKILVNPLGLTAFCASLCKKSAPQTICNP